MYCEVELHVNLFAAFQLIAFRIDLFDSFLALEKRVILTPHTTEDESAGLRDPRALPQCSNLREDLLKILR